MGAARASARARSKKSGVSRALRRRRVGITGRAYGRISVRAAFLMNDLRRPTECSCRRREDAGSCRRGLEDGGGPHRFSAGAFGAGRGTVE